ncbi:hypothetical protein SI65_08150 [Aspergillus cristatus]|uniref:HNH nuclease domain-containing protein n=1 Tax=Aspergillus cristatus TaxID=573508 RepID=A0A1E3B6Q9_ASPCR|nr:hypothetical protein SI65_08150 [Aspergillus cristatus]
MNRCAVFFTTLTKPATTARSSRNLAQMAKEADLKIQKKPAKGKRVLASSGHVEVHVPEVPARTPSPVGAASEAEASRPPESGRKCASQGGDQRFVNTTNSLDQSALPEACHIVPFAWNSNDTNIAATRALIMASCRLLQDADVLCEYLGEHLGSSDKDWNMLTYEARMTMLFAEEHFNCCLLHV